AVRVITVRITQMVLHMADDGVLPVAKINRAVRAHVDSGWPKVRVARTHEILLPRTGQPGTVGADFDPVNALEPNHVAVEKIPLEIRREMAAADQSRPRARP